MSTLLALRTVGKSLKFSAPAAQVYKFTCIKTPFVMAPYLNENRMTRLASTTQTSRTSTVPLPSDAVGEWRIIYRLPLIRMASAFNRVKIPYGLLNAITVPAAFALEQASQLPPTTTVLIASVGITSWLTLSIVSLVIKNLVGIMYINDTNDKLKLAYVDYWGKRHDTVIDLEDLVPENEKRRPSKFDFYQSLTLYSNENTKFKLLQRFGLIEDRETFGAIFGV